MIERALAASARWLLAHGRLTVTGLVLCTLLALLALRSFKIDPDVASLFPHGDPHIELLRSAGLSNESSRTLFVILRASDVSALVPEVIAELERSPYLVKVMGTKESFGAERAAHARRAPLYHLPEAGLLELEERLSAPGRQLALANSKRLLAEDPALGREVVSRDPLGLRWIFQGAAQNLLPATLDATSPYLIFADGTAALLEVQGEREPFDIDYSRQLVSDVRQRCAAYEVELLGGYQVACQDAARIRQDLESSLYWSIPLLLLFLIYSTRSIYLAHVLLLPVLLAVVWALGFGGWLLGPLTPLAVSGAAILMGLGIDFAIHYAERYTQERASLTHAEAIVLTHKETGRALLYGMTTSVAAFLTIGLGAFASLERFGILLALGLGCAWLATLLGMPLLLQGLRRLPGTAHSSHCWQWLETLVQSRHGRKAGLLLALLALLSWGVVLGRGLKFDADPNHLRPPAERLDLLFGSLGEALGFSPLGVLAFVPSSAPLEQILQTEDLLRAQGVLAVADGPQHWHGNNAQHQRLQLFHERTAGWLEGTLSDMHDLGFRAEAFRDALLEWRGRLEARPEVEAQAGQVEWRGESYWRTSFHPSAHPKSMAERSTLRTQLETLLSAGSLVVDPHALSDRIGPLLASALSRAALLSGIAVVLLVRLATGNLRACCIALVPVLAGLGITLAVASWLDWPLHPGNFIAVPLLLGLGVDDGIHMVLRAQAGSERLIADTGAAVWRTSATTCLGFGSLISAESPALAALGALVMVGIAACFAASIFLVPMLWRLLCKPATSPSAS